MSGVFWIAVYCLRVAHCYVSQDIPAPGLNAIPHRYPTEQACVAQIPVPGQTDPDLLHPRAYREVHKNTTCQAVTDVSCFNGGSVCTFAPANGDAAEKLKSMVVIPQ
jgi:hypothetical protein